MPLKHVKNAVKNALMHLKFLHFYDVKMICLNKKHTIKPIEQ